MLKIDDAMLAALVNEHGVYGTASALHWSYHRIRKRIAGSPGLRKHLRSAATSHSANEPVAELAVL